MNFLEPAVFFSLDLFLQKYGQMDSSNQVQELQRMLAPYVLRRLKETVEKSIPPKQETIIDVELTTLQKQYYRAIYEKNREFLLKGYVYLYYFSAIFILCFRCTKSNMPKLMNIEMQLRKCCNHPWLISGVEEKECPDGITWNQYFERTVAVCFLIMCVLHS